MGTCETQYPDMINGLHSAEDMNLDEVKRLISVAAECYHLIASDYLFKQDAERRREVLNELQLLLGLPRNCCNELSRHLYFGYLCEKDGRVYAKEYRDGNTSDPALKFCPFCGQELGVDDEA